MINVEKKVIPCLFEPNGQAVVADTCGALARKSSNTIKPVKEEILYLSKSIQLSEYTFEDENGKAKSAEIIRKRYMVGVNNSGGEFSEDCILSIAILKRHCLCDCLILVRQYRPTLKSYALEFPARIIEQNLVDQSGYLAMQEIRENTGYGATKVKYISPATATDPELCDSKVKLVSMIIDGDDPIKNDFIRAKKIEDQTGAGYTSMISSDDEEGEFDDIEIILLPINGLLDRLHEYCKQGTIVDSRVYAFAIGLKKGERLSQCISKPENIEIAI